MGEKYIVAIDQGTTSSRAVVFDRSGAIIAQVSRKHEQIYERGGWVSHNAKEIFFNVTESVKQALTGISVEDVAAIGITNQRETVVAWDKQTGEPVCDAIVWQCKRTAEMCKVVKSEMEPYIREKTGLLADPYFSASKMKWIIDNVPIARELLNKGRLAFGTIDSYLIYRLTNGKKFVTDYTNASRTLLFDIAALKWDNELMRYFGIPEEALPCVVASSGVIGHTESGYFGKEIPIAGIAGDQHAALFGQACFSKGDVKNTYGTGCFILENIGESPLISKRQSNLLTTIAWFIDGKATYAAEGSIFNAGSAIEWLINGVKMITDIPELEYIISSHDNGGVYFVPSFSGLGAPQWDMSARAAAFGMTLGTTKENIVRAVCESIAFQVKDALAYITNSTGVPVNNLNVDGGVSRNDTIMQFQADMLDISVSRPSNIETTALGAAGLAGLAVGFYSNFDALRTLKGAVSTFTPTMPEADRQNHYTLWQKAVSRAGDWA